MLQEAECAQLILPYAEAFWFQLVLVVHALAGLVGAALSVASFGLLRAAHFNVNCKLLLYSLLLCYLTHGANVLLGMLYEVAMWKLFPASCDLMISGVGCLAIRGWPNLCIFLFSPLHLSLAFERLCALKYGLAYERMGPRLGACFILGSVSHRRPSANLQLATGASAYAYIMSAEHFDDSGLVPYCTLSTRWTGPRASFFVQITGVFDVVCALLMLFTYCREHGATARNRTGKIFDLNIRFAALERRDANWVLFPFSVMHLIWYIIYEISYFFGNNILGNYVSGMAYKTIWAALFTLPYYAIASNLTLMWLLRHQRCCKLQRLLKEMAISANPDRITASYMQHW